MREGGGRLPRGGDGGGDVALVPLGGCHGHRVAENAWAELQSWNRGDRPGSLCWFFKNKDEW